MTMTMTMKKGSMPSWSTLLLWYCCLCIACGSFGAVAVSSAPPRVAIVGAGIGGASAAYHLSLQVPNANITIFEARDYVGGRLKEVEFGGKLVEVGGDAWSSVNPLMQQITQKLQVPISNNTFDGNGKTGIYTSKGWMTLTKDVLSHSLLSDLELYVQIEFLKLRLKENYKQMGENGGKFDSIEEYLTWGDLELYVGTNMSTFLSQYGVGDLAIDLVQPLTRTIYDEEVNTIHAFGGFVSLLAVVTPGFSAAGGNSMVPKRMIEASNAEVLLSTPVESISETEDNTYIVTAKDINNDTVRMEVDAVVIASPIEFVNINFTNLALANFTYRRFVEWHVTLVEAESLSPSYFNFTTDGVVPDNILTSENIFPFTVISPQDISDNGYTIYKIFSNDDVSDILGDVFVNLQSYYVQKWPYTFPHLNPKTSGFQPVFLASRILYVNTLESVASAMEESTLSGASVGAQLGAIFASI